MKRRTIRLAGLVAAFGLAATGIANAEVKTTAGLVQGAASADGKVRVFKGIPYAASPAGERRWTAPRPAAPWHGVRDATKTGPHCVQGPLFDDITFTEPYSEDCLNLNVWTPASGADERLPVMVWIHGGGFQVGAGPEPRHDGDAFARRGVVLVTFNYRLGVFGFLAHPELTRESERAASGNYGLMDQIAALQWVQQNIEAFGGDPKNVTIFGESAGSFAVSALMASPLAHGFFHKAIGESGAMLAGTRGPLAQQTLPEAEAHGAKFAAGIGAPSIATLRAKSAEEVLEAARKTQPWFSPIVDGYVLREDPFVTYTAGRQAKAPLLAGWNADEVRSMVTLAPKKPTVESFTADTRGRFGEDADPILKAYAAPNDGEAIESAAALAGDMFIGYATWKWIDLHAKTSGAPVYRYSFDRDVPIAPDTKINGVPATARDLGARHAAEIQYVFGTLDSVPKVTWEPSDRRLSEAMTTYWANFARTGDPNGAGLPAWGRFDGGSRRVMHFDEIIGDAPESMRVRYEALDTWVEKQRRAAGTSISQ